MKKIDTEIFYLLDDIEEVVDEIGYAVIDDPEELLDELCLFYTKSNLVVITKDKKDSIKSMKKLIRRFSHRYSIKKRKNFAIFITYENI